jgi:hypothetical protein
MRRLPIKKGRGWPVRASNLLFQDGFRVFSSGLTVLIALVCSPAMRAMAAPDAGALQQQIEREQTRPLPQQGAAEVIAPPPRHRQSAAAP